MSELIWHSSTLKLRSKQKCFIICDEIQNKIKIPFCGNSWRREFPCLQHHHHQIQRVPSDVETWKCKTCVCSSPPLATISSQWEQLLHVTMLQARPFIAVCHYSHMTTGHSSYILILNHQKTGDQCQCQEGGDGRSWNAE